MPEQATHNQKQAIVQGTQTQGKDRATQAKQTQNWHTRGTTQTEGQCTVMGHLLVEVQGGDDGGGRSLAHGHHLQ